MAKLDLLDRKEFTITLDSGEIIKGKFSYWATKRLSQKLGLPLKGFIERMSSDSVRFEDVFEIVQVAIEHSRREEGKPFPSDFEVCNWCESLSKEDFSKLQTHLLTDPEAEEKKNLT